MYYMAIDAGTGSVRAILFDMKLKQVESSQREWTHKEDSRFPGSMDFDVKQNWGLTVEVIKEVIYKANIKASDILAVSTTSMREGIVLYDENGNELWACANVDARANNEFSMLKSMSTTIEEDIYKISGQTFSLGALPRILWVKSNMPDIYDKTKKVSMFDNWLTYKLSGILTTEPSNGCTTGIFDLKERQWQPSIAAMCGLKDDIYPQVLEPGTVISTVSKLCSEQTGLDTKTLVVAGGGDAQLGAIGAGIVKDGQAAVFGGSFWQYEYNSKNPIIDSECRVRINCHAVKDIWQYEAIAFFPGIILRWYRDAFCQWEKEIEKQTGEEAYEQMNRHAEKYPPGCNGIISVFSDTMNYIKWRHAAPTFTNFGLDFEKFNRYSFYRAIMENAAIVTKSHVELVSGIVKAEPPEIVFANGASKSALWCQILSDVLNIPVKVPFIKETTALGAAMCASMGAGYSDISNAANQESNIEKTYLPNASNRQAYDTLYEKWKEVSKRQLELADGKVTSHMWKAPGV